MITLDKQTMSVLLKGFNFAITPKWIPTEKITCTTETVLNTTNYIKTGEIIQEVASTLRKAKQFKSNIAKEEKTLWKPGHYRGACW